MPYDRNGVQVTPSRKRRHTLLAAIEERGVTYAGLARGLGVTPQSFMGWIQKCKANKNFLLPAEHIPALSRALKIAPAKLRPDLYLPKWRFK